MLNELSHRIEQCGFQSPRWIKRADVMKMVLCIIEHGHDQKRTLTKTCQTIQNTPLWVRFANIQVANRLTNYKLYIYKANVWANDFLRGIRHTSNIPTCCCNMLQSATVLQQCYSYMLQVRQMQCCMLHVRTIILSANHSKSREPEYMIVLLPNVAHIWPTCVPQLAHIQSDNYAKSLRSHKVIDN